MTEAATALSVAVLDAEDHTQRPTDALAGAHEPELATKEADTDTSAGLDKEEAQDDDDELESRVHITTDKGEDAAAGELAIESAPEDMTKLKDGETAALSALVAGSEATEDADTAEQEHGVDNLAEDSQLAKEEATGEINEAQAEPEGSTPAPEHDIKEAKESKVTHDEVTEEEPVKTEEPVAEQLNEEEPAQIEEPTKTEEPVLDDTPVLAEETHEADEPIAKSLPVEETGATETIKETLDEEPVETQEAITEDLTGGKSNVEEGESVVEDLSEQPTGSVELLKDEPLIIADEPADELAPEDTTDQAVEVLQSEFAQEEDPAAEASTLEGKGGAQETEVSVEPEAVPEVTPSNLENLEPTEEIVSEAPVAVDESEVVDEPAEEIVSEAPVVVDESEVVDEPAEALAPSESEIDSIDTIPTEIGDPSSVAPEEHSENDAEDHAQMPIDALAGAHDSEPVTKEADTDASREQNEEDVQEGDDESAMKKLEDVTELKEDEGAIASDALEAEPEAAIKEEDIPTKDAIPPELEHGEAEDDAQDIEKAQAEFEESTPAHEQEQDVKEEVALDSEDHTQMPIDALSGAHELKEADADSSKEKNREDAQVGDDELESHARTTSDKGGDAAAGEFESVPEDTTKLKDEDTTASDALVAESEATEDANTAEPDHDVENLAEDSQFAKEEATGEINEAQAESEESTPSPEHDIKEAEESEVTHDEVTEEEPVKTEEPVAEQLNEEEPAQIEEPTKTEEPVVDDTPVLAEETHEADEPTAKSLHVEETGATETIKETLDEEPVDTQEAITEDLFSGEAKVEESESVIGEMSEQPIEPEEPLKDEESAATIKPSDELATEIHAVEAPVFAQEEETVVEASTRDAEGGAQVAEVAAEPDNAPEKISKSYFEEENEIVDNETTNITEEVEVTKVSTIESQTTHEAGDDSTDEAQPESTAINKVDSIDEQPHIVKDTPEDISGATTEAELIPENADTSDPIVITAPAESTAPEPIITQEEAFNIDSEANANADSIKEHSSESIIPVYADESQEIVVPAEELVPDVQVVMPTPSTEMLSFTSDEDEQVSNIPLAQRLAEAAGISASEDISSETLPSEEEAATPTEVKDEEIRADEQDIEEETDAIGSQEIKTPPAILLSEQDEADSKLDESNTDTSEGLTIETNVTEVPERPKSPWTPSYSVTIQGSAPVYGEETEEEAAAKESIKADAEKAASDAIVQKKDEAEPTSNEPLALNEGQQSESVLIIPAQEGGFEFTGGDSAPVEAEPVQSADFVESTGDEDTVTSLKGPIEDAPFLEEQERGFSVSEEAAINHEDLDVVVHPSPVNLSVDTSVTENLERPKSPWTPSYSVTNQGPGNVEPEVESDIEDDMGYKANVPETPDDEQHDVSQKIVVSPFQDSETDVVTAEAEAEIARPKSPYPPSYSVHQMGPGMQEAGETGSIEDVEELKEDGTSRSLISPLDEPTLASPASESVADSNPSSNDPEVPSSPRSDLGISTPGFDSRSEISDASNEPIAPSSPRTDPEARSFTEDIKTPLVVGSEEPNASISPLQTPLMASKGNLTEDHDNSNASETDGFDNVAQASEISTEVASSDLETVKGNGDQTGVFYDMPDVPNLASQLNIPEFDVMAAPLSLQPVIVTNTLSTDSAYTQLSDAMSPSQETGTNVTTPDMETLAMPKTDIHEGSEAGSIEPLDEEATSHDSDKRFSSSSLSRTPSGTDGTYKSLGITHTLAMRSFPSAFNEGTDNVSVPEQSKQTPAADTPDMDQLSLPSSRRRLESTTSSLVFPGGWVTSPSKKERPSLEVASGEFSKPIVEGIPLSPEPIHEASEPPAAESKWRCIIM